MVCQRFPQYVRFSPADAPIGRAGLCGLILCIALPVFAADKPANIFLGTPQTKSTQQRPAVKSYADPSFHPVVFDTPAVEIKSETTAPVALKAHAGDDVLAFVGRKATLNGGQSQPAGRVGVRWIQISGPAVQEAFEQGPNLVVIPPTAGVYQFLLVVAEGGRISEPDSVTLTAVDHPEAPAPNQVKASQPPRLQPVEEAPPPVVEPAPKSQTSRELMVKLAAKTLHDVPHSAGMGGTLAELFGDIAQRMSLYTNYAEAQQEISRRITTLLEAESADIGAWNQKVFEPLTSALGLWVRPAGLDLTDPAQWSVPLGPVARQSLADGLSAFAEGFRGQSPAARADSATPKPVAVYDVDGRRARE